MIIFILNSEYNLMINHLNSFCISIFIYKPPLINLKFILDTKVPSVVRVHKQAAVNRFLYYL